MNPQNTFKRPIQTTNEMGTPDTGWVASFFVFLAGFQLSLKSEPSNYSRIWAIAPKSHGMFSRFQGAVWGFPGFKGQIGGPGRKNRRPQPRFRGCPLAPLSRPQAPSPVTRSDVTSPRAKRWRPEPEASSVPLASQHIWSPGTGHKDPKQTKPGANKPNHLQVGVKPIWSPS